MCRNMTKTQNPPQEMLHEIAMSHHQQYEIEKTLKTAFATFFTIYFTNNPEAILFISGASVRHHELEKPRGSINRIETSEFVARVDIPYIKAKTDEFGAKTGHQHATQMALDWSSYSQDSSKFRATKHNNQSIQAKNFSALPPHIGSLDLIEFSRFERSLLLQDSWEKLAHFQWGSETNGMTYTKNDLPEIIKLLDVDAALIQANADRFLLQSSVKKPLLSFLKPKTPAL